MNTHQFWGPGAGSVGRWGDGNLPGGEYGEMGEIFIKGNYPDMI
ncbi:hypothetical protein LYNGBM3L_01370 [Moorena producens 3L]|uniref:Uncharacterized protein n=1 Tax=Moorena producens 3L TaxID=489825 RepID=F4XIE5_9CYAN|nr:hypothetical protein LYNGBM3L_01370 [Moorena producens 3L]